MKQVALVALLLLAGCEQKTWTEAEISDIAADAATDENAELRSQVAELTERVDAIATQQGLQQRQIAIQGDAVDATAEQTAHNAKVANENAIRDMTRRGACGKEWVQLDSGGSMLRNIECTKADLKE